MAERLMIKVNVFSVSAGTTKNGHKKFDYAVRTNDDRLFILSAFVHYQFSPEVEVIVIYEKQGRYNHVIFMGPAIAPGVQVIEAPAMIQHLEAVVQPTPAALPPAQSTQAVVQPTPPHVLPQTQTLPEQAQIINQPGPSRGRKRSTTARGKGKAGIKRSKCNEKSAKKQNHDNDSDNNDFEDFFESLQNPYQY